MGKNTGGFHDGMLKVDLTVPAKKVILIQPAVQYWVPLSSYAKKEYSTADSIKNSYNPNGPVKCNVVYGVTFTYSF